MSSDIKNSNVHFLVLLVIDIILIVTTWITFYLFAWMMFGEGANSLLYKKASTFVLQLVVGIISTFPFLLKAKRIKNEQFKSFNYYLIVVLNAILFVIILLASLAE